MRKPIKAICKMKTCVMIIFIMTAGVFAVTMQSGSFIVQTETHDSGGTDQSGTSYSTLSAAGQKIISYETAGTTYKAYNGYIHTINYAPVLSLPSSVTLIWPTDAMTDIATSGFPFYWEEPSTGTQPFTYTLEVDDNSDFSSPVISQSGLTSTLYDVTTELNNSTTYYWRLSAENIAGSSGFGSAFSFVTQAAGTETPTAPSVPVPAVPADSSVDEKINTTCIWNPADGTEPITYDFQLATDYGMTQIVSSSTALTNTYISIAGLAYSTTYYWQVKATNSYGESAWSNVRQFTTMTEQQEQQSTPTTIQEMIDSESTMDGDTIVLSSGSIYTENIVISKDIILEGGMLAPESGYAVVGQGADGGEILRNCVVAGGNVKDIALAENVTFFNPDPNETITIENSTLVNCLIELGATVKNSTFQNCWVEATDEYFNDPLNYDFLLTSKATGAIDQARDLSYKFTKDIVGVTRGIDILDMENYDSKAWDIGAYEFVLSDGYIDLSAVIDGSVSELPYALSAPVLTSPEDGINGITAFPTLKWEASSESGVTYWVQIASDESFYEIVISQYNIEAAEYKPASSISHGDYWWRVKAVKDENISAWSETRKISIVGYTRLKENKQKGNNACFITKFF